MCLYVCTKTLKVVVLVLTVVLSCSWWWWLWCLWQFWGFNYSVKAKNKSIFLKTHRHSHHTCPFLVANLHFWWFFFLGRYFYIVYWKWKAIINLEIVTLIFLYVCINIVLSLLGSNCIWKLCLSLCFHHWICGGSHNLWIY